MTLDRTVAAFRVVAAAWLAGWFWKAEHFARYLVGEAREVPLAYDAFPAALRDPALASVLWALPALTAAALLRPRPASMRAASALMAAASLGLCVHLETCSDATFVTSFWVALWLLWLTWGAGGAGAASAWHGRTLARSIVALMFLGALVGKLTPEYTGGEALHELYFLSRDEWPYPALREALSAEALREAATWSSRAALALEGACVALPLVPHRVGVALALAAMAGMIAVTTFYLFSVLGCLMGLLGGSLLLEARAPQGSGCTAR